MKKEDEIKIDFKKRKELESVLGAEQVSYCYQCGACVGDCPTARFHEGFNPREIMLRSLMGDTDKLLKKDSMIWLCSNCYNCYERCPQDVRPVEVIIALKNLAVKKETAPDEISSVTQRINETGFSVPLVASTDKLRGELGLPPLKKFKSDELKIITQPDTEEDK